jgi:hypothetical protein
MIGKRHSPAIGVCDPVAIIATKDSSMRLIPFARKASAACFDGGGRQSPSHTGTFA